MEIDNNLVENLIRPFALGRKNWLFSGSPRGAHASALFYSLIATAKANGLNPFDYLNILFEDIRVCKVEEDYRRLLPFNINLSTRTSPNAYHEQILTINQNLTQGGKINVYQ